MTADEGEEIQWRDWSSETFEEARTSGRLVLLDLTASWCHWCHVMDSTTYSDVEVIRRINEMFVPVRVDIDKRPDVSERYNRGGFPTTAFLSDRGEPVWGATYIPPAEMKRVIEAVLRAKGDGSIDEALDKERASCDSGPTRPAKGQAFVHEDYEKTLAEVMDKYDVEFGGFGTEPKFPHPDCVELVLRAYGDAADSRYADATRATLLGMADGLYDPVEGGVFRYSVSRDWKVPHYEKMLETNAGYLLNLAQAHAILGDMRFSDLAGGVADYMLSVLSDPVSGSFFGSQDAEEAYYKLDAGAREGARRPSIDRTCYAGWNFEAARALAEAGKLLVRMDWIDAGRTSMKSTMAALWDDRSGLFRHTPGQDLYLFEDQVSFLLAAVSYLELDDDVELRRVADKLVEAVDRRFAHPEGGYSDVVPAEDSVGELRTPLRSLIWNSRWATAMALYGLASDRQELTEKASEFLSRFDLREIKAYGIFSSAYLNAWRLLSEDLVKVEVFVRERDIPLPELWRAAKAMFPLDAAVFLRRGSTEAEKGSPCAVVCGRAGCSAKIHDVEHLGLAIARARGSQG